MVLIRNIRNQFLQNHEMHFLPHDVLDALVVVAADNWKESQIHRVVDGQLVNIVVRHLEPLEVALFIDWRKETDKLGILLALI